MATKTQKEILAVVEQILDNYPDYRFGQLISNLATYARGPFRSATYDVEDAEFLAAATQHLQAVEKRRTAREEIKELTAAKRAEKTTA